MRLLRITADNRASIPKGVKVRATEGNELSVIPASERARDAGVASSRQREGVDTCEAARAQVGRVEARLDAAKKSAEQARLVWNGDCQAVLNLHGDAAHAQCMAGGRRSRRSPPAPDPSIATAPIEHELEQARDALRATHRARPSPRDTACGSFADLLSERATALGTTPAELVRRLEEAISVVAPLHFKTTARFEVAWQPVLQTFEVKAVVDGSGLPGGKPGDDAVFDVFWRVEDQTQARSQDAAYQATLGFTIAGSGFDEVVEAVTRDVLGLPAAGPLGLLRDDWLRLANACIQTLREAGTKHALELKTTSQALPQPVGGVHIYDAALEGPKLNDFRATPRALDTTIDVAGQPLHLGTQSWDALTVSVLGQPDLATLEAWTTRWMANADVAPEGQLAGVVHRVEVLRYATGCALTVDMGSAPVSALEELVVLLRPFGAVSLDEAALQSLAGRRHEGGRDDLVPLVRTETGVFSEHLVGPLWVQYAVESKQVFTTVTPDELSGLGLDLASARALALENLRRRLPPAHFTGHLGVYMLTLPGEGGHFEASLLLLDEVWARAAPLVKGDVVAALPGRDLLLFTGTDDVESVKKVRSVAADALEKGLEYPLTQQLFVRRDGGWRVFDVLDAGPSNANLRGSYRTSSKSTV